IGICSAPNSHFMREAARLGRGTFTYIGSVTEVKEKMVALFGKLESPALTDVRLELTGGSAVDAVPARIPDVYLGEPVTVARRGGTLPPRMVLRGQLGPNRWERELSLQAADAAAGLSVHWARGKIAGLLDTRPAGAPGGGGRP